MIRTVLLFLALATPSFAQNCCPHVASMCQVATMSQLSVPPGFCLNIFGNVNNARSLDTAFHPVLGHVVFVGTNSGNMNVLIDSNMDGTSDRTVQFPLGQTRLHNAKVSPEGHLWVGQGQNIRVFDDIFQHLSAGSRPTGRIVYNQFGTSSHHGHRYVNFPGDGTVFISSGAPCNVCRPEGESCNTSQNCNYGRILRANYTGKPTLTLADMQVYANGVRNSVGFDFSPVDGALWFAENGRDNWGNDRPPDELNRAPVAGLHFGFPFCHGLEPDSAFNPTGSCAAYQPPAVSLGPHVASLGMTFYRDRGQQQFPAPFNQGIYIAEHGSWNRNPFLGFRITHVSTTPDGTGGGNDYKVFLEGFLQNASFGTRWGRPADIQELPDGSLIFSDDLGNRIFRISYRGTEETPGLGKDRAGKPWVGKPGVEKSDA